MGGWHSLGSKTITEANLAVCELGLFCTLMPGEVADPVAPDHRGPGCGGNDTLAHRTESQGDREEVVVPSGTTHLLCSWGEFG